MKRFVLFCCVMLCMVGSVSGCSPNKGEGGGHISAEAEEQYTEVTNSVFQLKLPKDWIVQNLADNGMRLIHDELVIGGVVILSFDADQSLSGILPDHSEVVSQETLQGYFAQGHKVHLILTQPTATLIRSQQDEMHYYFIVDGYAYDLYFNMDRVSGATMDKIAGGFSILHPKQAEDKTGDGSVS